MNFLACNIVIVSDDQAYESVSNFFESLFDESFIKKTEPCVHFVLSVSEHATLVLIKANCCDKDLLVQFSIAGE